MRGESAPEIHGLGGLSEIDSRKVREGTLLALRSINIMGVAYDRDFPSWMETPKRKRGFPSVLKFQEARHGVTVRAYLERVDQIRTIGQRVGATGGSRRGRCNSGRSEEE